MQFQTINPKPRASHFIPCVACGGRAEFAVMDAKPGTYCCRRCMDAVVDYSAQCVILDKLLRQISIPGSSVTVDDVNRQRRKVEAMAPINLG